MRRIRIRIRNPAQEMRLRVEGPRKADRALFYCTLCRTGLKADSCWSAVLWNRNRNRRGIITCRVEPEP
jgi:hypothetical protein